jgi:hypothetical protein
VINLNNPESALAAERNGNILETTMDDIEIDIVFDYMKRNLKYME